MPISSAAQARGKASAQARNPAGSRIARSPGPAAIRVKSRLVAVPAVVINKRRQAGRETKAEARCLQSDAEAFFALPPSKPFLPKMCNDLGYVGLKTKDFSLFIGGKRQRVLRVTHESKWASVRDNFGHHEEFSRTPAGEWDSQDLRRAVALVPNLPLYNIEFVPPSSTKPGCHRLKIKVDRPHSAVYASREYCTGQTPSDILKGSTFGKQLRRDLTSERNGKIPLSVQAGWFYAGTGKPRVQVALEFPSDELHGGWKGDLRLPAKIGVLGMVYHDRGALAARFSDLGCCRDMVGQYVWGREGAAFPGVNPYYGGRDPMSDPLLFALNLLDMPTRYQTQINLSPGHYDLRLALSDGEKFGRVEATLNIPKYDGKRLALSSVMLCKHYRDAHVAAVEAAAANLAPRYVPLVSKGIRFTPSGSTTFYKTEPLIAYFQVYEPLLATHPDTTVEAHVRILAAKTGKVIKTFHAVNAAIYKQPGNTTISIARKIPFGQLPKGAYRLEVQATDSAGESTTWRTADFTVLRHRPVSAHTQTAAVHGPGVPSLAGNFTFDVFGGMLTGTFTITPRRSGPSAGGTIVGDLWGDGDNIHTNSCENSISGKFSEDGNDMVHGTLTFNEGASGPTPNPCFMYTTIPFSARVQAERGFLMILVRGKHPLTIMAIPTVRH